MLFNWFIVYESVAKVLDAMHVSIFFPVSTAEDVLRVL